MTEPETSLIGPVVGAEEVLHLAREWDVPLRQDPALAGALITLDVDRSLPPELFRAVAEVMAFVSQMDGK